MDATRSRATDPSQVALLEREAEIATIASALDGARAGSGSMLVIEGEPGIGKSSLIAHARSLASERGMTVFEARGSELEEMHPFGVVIALFSQAVRSRPDLVEGAAAPAAAIFGAPSGSNGEAGSDRQTILHALHWVTINATDPRPLLIAVDDGHWVDPASLEFLAYLGRRISSLSACLVVGLRPAEASRTSLGEQVRSHRDADRIRLRPLSAASVETLIHRHTGTDVDATRRKRIVEMTGGNPFYVVELLRSPTAAAPASEGGPAVEGVPDAIAASIRRRLADTEGTSRRVAEAIAVLGDEATVERVARLAQSTAPATVQAIRRMTDRAILDPARLAFIHPIVRSGVLEAIPATLRPELHRSAARVLEATSAPAAAAAAHLLLCEPSADAAVVALLRDAARQSMTSGDAGSAVRFLERARAEPPDEASSASVWLELAQAEAAAGRPDAPARFDEALALLRNPHERAQARLAQGHALIQATRWPDAMRAFDAGLAEVDHRDVELKSRLEAGYISSAYVGLTDLAEANRRLEHILAAPLHDPAHRELAAWTAFQATVQLRGTAAEARALARRAVTDARHEELIHSSQVIEIAAGVFLATGDLLEELQLLTEAMAAAHRLNAFSKAGVYAYCRSLPNYLTGHLQDAVADGETALAAHELGMEVFYPGTCAALAWTHIERGDIDAATRVLAMDDERWGQRLDFQFMTLIARGRVAFARGDLAYALREFERVRDAGEALGVRGTHVLGDWRTWSALILRSLDRPRDARRVAEEAVRLAEGWDEPMAIGRAEWALGMARGGPAGIEHLRRSVELLERTPARLFLARSVLDLGATLRRTGSLTEARVQLLRAVELAHGMGAVRMRERARSELAAAGARPRRYVLTGVDALTGSELRVARLAADGMTNRGIAQSLFVTPKAVEFHLANAYRKLGIRGRADLAAALAPTQEAASV